MTDGEEKGSDKLQAAVIDTPHVFVGESKVSTWEDINELRVVGCLQDGVVLGTMLQTAMRCREDGRIKWRNIPVQWMSHDAYVEATGPR